MLDIVLHRDAERAFQRLPKHMKTRCSRVFVALQHEPFRATNVKRLHGELDGCYRVRVGGWRIIYEVDTNAGCIIVHDIGPRGDAY